SGLAEPPPGADGSRSWTDCQKMSRPRRAGPGMIRKGLSRSNLFQKDLSQLRSSDPRVVWLCSRLELLSARERPGGHRIESGITDELGSDVHRGVIVTRKRNPHLVPLPMRLRLKCLEVNAVERLHPPYSRKHRRRPTG